MTQTKESMKGSGKNLKSITNSVIPVNHSLTPLHEVINSSKSEEEEI